MNRKVAKKTAVAFAAIVAVVLWSTNSFTLSNGRDINRRHNPAVSLQSEHVLTNAVVEKTVENLHTFENIHSEKEWSIYLASRQGAQIERALNF